jgi:hypothetical protein
MANRKKRENMTARERIAEVIGWADRQGFVNIAAELRHALAQLDRETRAR